MPQLSSSFYTYRAFKKLKPLYIFRMPKELFILDIPTTFPENTTFTQ
jgi:hypothetical protein